MENLLLSSAAGSLDLDDVEVLNVPASRANFFEVGFRKPIGNRLRLDASHYWRTFRNYIDDDVFLNTGLSFPITFDTARIEGTEVRLEMPRWRGISSFVSYSNMVDALHRLSPVASSLRSEADELRMASDLSGQPGYSGIRCLHRFALSRIGESFTTGVRYGSGLPIELEDDDDDEGLSRSFHRSLTRSILLAGGLAEFQSRFCRRRAAVAT